MTHLLPELAERKRNHESHENDSKLPHKNFGKINLDGDDSRLIFRVFRGK